METLLTLSMLCVVLFAFVRDFCSGKRGPQPGDGRMDRIDVDYYGVRGRKTAARQEVLLFQFLICG
jgi:hypothetical protein